MSMVFLRKKFFAWILYRNVYRYNKLVDNRKKLLFLNLKGKVLEIGAGTGTNIKYCPSNIEYTALEPNEAMHQYLTSELKKYDLKNIRIIDGFAENIPSQNNEYDAVVATLVLCSTKDPKRVVGEIIRVLKPGGSFLFLEHVAAPSHTLLRNIQHYLKGIWSFVADGCSPECETGEIIKSAGFTRVDLEKFKLPIRSVVQPHIIGTAIK